MLGFLLTYGGAVALHAVWDGSTRLSLHVGVAVVGPIALGGFVFAAHREPRS